MASEHVLLEIVRPKKTEQHTVKWVHIEGSAGSFIVGPDHHPLISTLKPKGTVTYALSNGSEHTLDVFGGILKVTEEKAVIVLDS